ncbi:hypothetical protein FQN57_002316 [Myotisia sp. PD_48]|nr:hypothetical protein FQN57_002316 [Myotisia sp. PD_48]
MGDHSQHPGPSSPCFDSFRQTQRASLPPQPHGAARHAKRLTLNFPINIPPQFTHETLSGQNSPSSKTVSPAPYTSSTTSTMPTPTRSLAGTPALNEPPDEGYDFLTALAAQERKVLELKEELQRAESELTTLKKQWESNERLRKRTQVIHHAEAMKTLKQQPLRSPGSNPDQNQNAEMMETASPISNEAPTTSRQNSKDLGRKSSYRNSMSHLVTSPGMQPPPPKPRTVFQGSRHTRTLSLLSSAAGNDFNPPFPQPRDAIEARRPSRYPRSATLPSVERQTSDGIKSATNPAKQKASLDQGIWRRSLPPIPQDGTTEALVRTGKQMATDFRDGLYTFLDDIRQATVGEEGINGTATRSSQAQLRVQQSGANTPNSSRSMASSRTGRSTVAKSATGSNPTATAADVSFWGEFGIIDVEAATTNNTANTAKTRQGGSPAAPNLMDVDDNWDIWDTPQPKTHTPSSSSSTFPSKREHSPSTNASSPRTSASLTDFKPIDPEQNTGDQSDGIPWPALSKLTPSKLTRTASNLMAEWERSLSPDDSENTAKPKVHKDE